MIVRLIMLVIRSQNLERMEEISARGWFRSVRIYQCSAGPELTSHSGSDCETAKHFRFLDAIEFYRMCSEDAKTITVSPMLKDIWTVEQHNCSTS